MAGPHHRGNHPRRSAQLRARAYADPTTRCWRCDRTLAQVQLEHPDAIWHAGHVHDGEIDGPLLPECSPCNHTAGGVLRAHQHQEPKHMSEPW